MFCVAKRKTSSKVLHKSSNKDIFSDTKVLKQANKRTTRSFLCIASTSALIMKIKTESSCNLLHEMHCLEYGRGQNKLLLCISKLLLLLTCGWCRLQIPANFSVVYSNGCPPCCFASSVIAYRTTSQSNLATAFRLILYLNKRLMNLLNVHMPPANVFQFNRLLFLIACWLARRDLDEWSLWS